MKKLLILLGVLSSVLWRAVTVISKGLTEETCRFLNSITFELFPKEIFQMQHGFYYQVSNNDMPTMIFIILFFILFGVMFWALCKIEKSDVQRSTLGIIVFFSVLFRLIALPSEPIHENDFYRYLWDGKSAINGINPFKYAPADLFMHEYGFEDDYYDDLWKVTIKAKAFNSDDQKRLNELLVLRDENELFYGRIGHYEVPTIYPPAAQAVFLTSIFLKPDSFFIMKILFMLFDVGVIYLIILLLKHLKMNPAMVVVYGWSPLVIKEFANSGHYDPIAIFFTLLSIYLFLLRREVAGIFILALAALSKFFSGVLFPILVRPFRLKYLILFVSTMLIFYLPYFLWDQTGINGVFDGLNTYNEQWAYNASIFAVVYNVLDMINPILTETLKPAKMVVAGMFLLLLISLSWKAAKNDRDLLYKCFLAIGGLFIINPVGDPWYFCWCIPFLCIFPTRSWLLLSALLVLSYLNFHSDIEWVSIRIWNIKLISWIIYLPFFGYLIYERLVCHPCESRDL